MTYDEALDRFNADMSNCIYDSERKQVTQWFADRIGDIDKAEQLYRAWMAQYAATCRYIRR